MVRSDVSVPLADTVVPPATVVAESVNEASAIPILSSRAVSALPFATLFAAVACAVWENAPGAVTRTVTQTSSSNEPATPMVGIWQVTTFAFTLHVPSS